MDAIRDAQHARLLAGLADSVREKGLERTQVTDIVRHARASRRTFYNHFEDKEACFVELMETMSEVVMAGVEGAIDHEAPIATQVEAAIDAYLELVMSDPALTRTFASPGLGERIVLAQRQAFERYSALIVSVVESDSERDPGVEPIAVERAYLLVTGLHQTLMRALVRGDDLVPVAAEIKAVMKTALAGQGARAGAG